MNYKKIYNQLIERARSRTNILDLYEKHHIIPRSMGGSNKKINLVRLSYREHFIAHLLLHKMYPDNFYLLKCIIMMSKSSKITSKEYSWIKDKFSKEQRIRLSGRTSFMKGKKHTDKSKKKISSSLMGNQHLKGHIHSDQTKLKMSNTHKNRINYTKHTAESKLKISKNKGCNPVKVYKNGIYLKTYQIRSELLKELKLHRSHFYSCLSGQLKHYKGYTFEYEK